jgi:hypothetical protein
MEKLYVIKEFINELSTLLPMSREIYQKTGLIIALAIAGIALPTSIVSFMREPIIINNYEQNYNAYYNQTYYQDNTTAVTTIKTEPHQIAGVNFEAIIFDYSEGDKMIAVWDCNQPNSIDVLFMNKENFQLFIDGLSFATVLSAINTTAGFFEYEIVIPNLYFTVFYTNYSNAWFSYQVVYYHFYNT